jgi:hypothetical protein
MATVTKKIDTLPAMELTVANNDKLVMLDVDQSAVDMTKLMTMSQIPISLPAQLAESVVENAAIANDAVRTSKIKDANVTLAKIEKSLNAYVLGNKASHATTPDGVVEISPSAANQVLLGSTGTTNTVDFGKVTVNHIGNISARTVIGNATNASAAPTAIAANTDGYVLRRSGDTIGFGKVKAAGIDSMTSAQLKAIVSDETGSGALVFGTSPTIGTATLNSPTLVTPALGTPASGTLTNCTGLPAAGIASMTSAQLAARVTDETGTGKLVFATSPTLVTPALGTPASGTLTNCTGLPSTGIVAMTSADLAARVTDETGSGKLVFATSPTLVTPALGTPSSGVLTNCTGLPTTGLANKAVTEAKLGAIKRMIMIPVFGLEDAVIVKNFTRIMAWHPGLAGHVVTGAWAALLGAVSSSGSVGINLINAGGTMCSISIPSSAWSAQSGTISTSLDDIASLATFSVNVTASGSGAIGLTIYLEVTG